MSPKAEPKVVLDHVAIATADPTKLKRVLFLLGLSDHGSEIVASQGVVTHFLRSEPEPSAMELLVPTDPQGVIAQFIAKRGPGIHHVCFRVSDLEQLSKKLRAEGVRLIYATSQKGAHGKAVNFIHPESTGGVLMEISQ